MSFVGIHRYAYSSIRPPTPNLTDVGLGLAPGATVAVYLHGTNTLAALYTDQVGMNPLANPFVSDANAFYAYYVDPTLGDVDEQLSGTGIVTPYTLSSVLNLDPRVGGTSADLTALTAALAAETTAREAADLAITQSGTSYPLGGSVQSGQFLSAQGPVFDRIRVTIDGDLFPDYVLTVRFNGKTDDAGTSVQPTLRNITTSANVGTGTVVTSTVLVSQSFTATLAAGVNVYELDLIPGNNAAAVYGNGYIELAVP